MRIIKDTPATARRPRRMVVELSDGEEVIAIMKRQHYRLGGQLADVVSDDVIAEAKPVWWCSVQQIWDARK